MGLGDYGDDTSDSEASDDDGSKPNIVVTGKSGVRLAKIAVTSSGSPMAGLKDLVSPSSPSSPAEMALGTGTIRARHGDELGEGSAKAAEYKELCSEFLGEEVGSEDLDLGLQEKIVNTLKDYQRGRQHFVDYMRVNRNFRNPEILRKLVETLKVKSRGSNFPTHIFDPNGYQKEDYIGEINKQQKEYLKRLAQKQRSRTSIEFTGASSASGGADRPKVKRSKWDQGTTSTVGIPAGNPLLAQAQARAIAAQKGAAMRQRQMGSSGNAYQDLMKMKGLGGQ